MAAEVANSNQFKVTPEASPGSIFEKAMLRKRPGVFNDNDNSKRHVISSVIFGKHNPKRHDPEARKGTPFRFENSADEIFTSSDYTECTANIFSVNVQSALTSDLCSYEQGDTPVSKTKRFNSGFQLWINKIQYYKKQGPFHRFRRHHGFIDEKDLTSAADELPEEAYTCYNQFKTQNLTDFFDSLMIKQTSNRSQEVNLPVYSPLNHLTYENLQELREQVFGLPPFSGDSGIDLEQEFSNNGKILKVLDDENPESQDSMIANLQTPSTINLTEVEDVDKSEERQGLAHDSDTQDEINSAGSQGPQEINGECLVNSTESEPPQEGISGELVNSTESQPVAISGSEEATPTPELIKHLYDDTIHTGDQFELDSTQFRQIDSLSLHEAVLTPIERKIETFNFLSTSA